MWRGSNEHSGSHEVRPAGRHGSLPPVGSRKRRGQGRRHPRPAASWKPSAAPCCRTSSAASLLDALRQECADIAPRAHFDVETVNVYNIPVDADLPADHPGRRTFQRGNAFVARDRIPADALISRLYSHTVFQHFIARCFGLPQLHELADPLSGLVLNVVSPGMEHPWHFDTNEFTVSMLTQQAQDGGVFEYCPHIRSPHTESFDDVRDVLDGRGERLTRRLPLKPGRPPALQGPLLPAPGQPRPGRHRAALRDLRLQRAARRHRERGAHPAALRPGTPRPRGRGGPSRQGRPTAGLADGQGTQS